MKKLLCILLLSSVLFAGKEAPLPNYPPPEKELEILKNHAKNPLSLSQTISELIQGVCDDQFDQAFWAKIKKAEQEKYTGEYVDRWPNGQLKIQANLIDGVPNEHFHGWFENGEEAFKGFFDNGKKVGIHLAFYPKKGPDLWHGIGRRISYDLKGKLHGEQFSRYANLRTSARVEYKKGLIHGKEILYNYDRSPVYSKVYERGRLKKTE